MEININSKITLNNGVEMPVFGLGTYALRGEPGIQAVLWAIEIGYRFRATFNSKFTVLTTSIILSMRAYLYKI